MVKTRHTPDVAEESPATFLSIEKRRSRLHRNNARLNHDDGSDDSGVIQFNSGRQAGRRSHSDDTPIQRRALRTSAKRVSYVEDYIDVDFTQQRRRGRSVRIITDDETDDDNLPTKQETVESSRMTRTRRRDVSAPVEDSESSSRPARSTRRSQSSRLIDQEAKDMKEEELQDLEQDGIRRSSRTRRLMYNSFDQKANEQSGYVADEEPKRKRARTDTGEEEEQEENSNEEDDDEQFKDMYSRVKRKRKCVKRDMYGMPIEESDDGNEEEEDDSDDDSDDESSDGEEEDDNDENNEEGEKTKKKSKDVAPRSYYLRENKPRTQLYNAPLHEKRPRTMSRMFNVEMSHHSPARRRNRPVIGNYMSPARRKVRGSRRRAAFHGSSSTSSSSSDSSDEEKFQRRKAKSMMKSRQRCLPMNFDQELVNSSNILRDRQKIGSSLADVDPMSIDRSITFDSVGGLGKHIRALKEMVVFPLLYPEIFERFKIAPPRGVLFYGPPGTGKTLVARALANECSVDDRRVAFYMRKGADCLSKWVGESERQLRLLFDQAYQTRPSIIFFDEIDGLAPVRSSRQDQIHSSIVSTLLALMDGLDSRGEIVVIGATNRIDSIDPALRRPGRFDREFLFPLPSIQARSQILKIQTKDWNPKLCDKFVTEVAEHCTGYCGADMKALCTEAALLALRRRYPQIYTSAEKLQIDVSSINVNARDFYLATQNIVPTSQRSNASPARSLNSTIAPLLLALYQEVVTKLNEIFPSVLSQLANLDTDESKEKESGDEGVMEEDTESSMAIYEQRVDKRRKNMPELPEKFLNFTSYANQHPSTHRPRLMLSGSCDQGQTSHLAPAVLHHMEQLPVHVLDLSTLFAVSARTPEEGCAQIFREARRTAPSIVYLPHINQWWSVLPDTVRMTVLTLIQDIDPSCPLLILATSEDTYTELDFSLQDLFDEFSGEVINMRNPSSEERKLYFQDLLLTQATQPPPQRKVAAQRLLEVLPKAPPPEPRKFTDQELAKIHEHEEATLRELRLFLRDVLNKLGRDRKFFIFTKPVDIEDVPDYYEIIKTPMDLSSMMSKIDLHRYTSVKEFMQDIEQICMNALEYNPDKDPQSRVIRHRACALRDTTYAIMKAELDPEFEKICLNIVESRKKRGEDGSKTVPAFYHTRPLKPGQVPSVSDTRTAETISNTPPSPSRTSTRLRRSNVDDGPSLEEVERSARILRREQRQHSSPEKRKDRSSSQEEARFITPDSSKISGSQKSQDSMSDNKCTGSVSDSKGSQSDRNTSGKKKAKRSIWGRSGYTRRRRSVKRNRSMLSEGGGEEEGEDNSDGDISDEEMEIDTNETRDYISDMSVSKSSSQDIQARRESVTKCLNVEVNMRPSGDNQRSPSYRSPREEVQRSPPALEPISQVHVSPGASDTIHRLTRPESGSKSPRFRHSSGQHSPRTLDCAVTNHSDSHQKSPRTSVTSKHPDKLAKNSVSNTLHDITDSSSVQSSQDSTTQDKNSSSLLKPKNIVVNGFVDSGVGSSDSNGDSNDSGSKLTLSAAQETEAATTQAQAEATINENNETECTESKSAPSPQFRVTRSRIQTKTQEKALEILQGPVEPLVVDHARLARLLDMVVLLTEGYNIGKLEKLYSVLGQCVYQHRLEYNKMTMIEMMERRLRQYTSSVSERLKIEKARASTSIMMT